MSGKTTLSKLKYQLPEQSNFVMRISLYLLVEQYSPENPSSHEQLNMPMASMHVPPLRQGVLAHSLISIRIINK